MRDKICVGLAKVAVCYFKVILLAIGWWFIIPELVFDKLVSNRGVY